MVCIKVMVEEEETEKWLKYYSSFHQILLVGEGDFSFTLCLAQFFGSASNIVATTLDSYGLFLSPRSMCLETRVSKLWVLLSSSIILLGFFFFMYREFFYPKMVDLRVFSTFFFMGFEGLLCLWSCFHCTCSLVVHDLLI